MSNDWIKPFQKDDGFVNFVKDLATELVLESKYFLFSYLCMEKLVSIYGGFNLIRHSRKLLNQSIWFET